MQQHTLALPGVIILSCSRALVFFLKLNQCITHSPNPSLSHLFPSSHALLIFHAWSPFLPLLFVHSPSPPLPSPLLFLPSPPLSMSLFLGNEIFDIYKQPEQGRLNHLFVRQGTGLQGQAVFRSKLTFRCKDDASHAAPSWLFPPLISLILCG